MNRFSRETTHRSSLVVSREVIILTAVWILLFLTIKHHAFSTCQPRYLCLMLKYYLQPRGLASTCIKQRQSQLPIWMFLNCTGLRILDSCWRVAEWYTCIKEVYLLISYECKWIDVQMICRYYDWNCHVYKPHCVMLCFCCIVLYCYRIAKVQILDQKMPRK